MNAVNFVVLIFVPISFAILSVSLSASARLKETVLIVLLARNKAHTLPYFLTHLHNLDYPKDRISLWIRSDHNEDNTVQILETWIQSVHDDYHSVNFHYESSSLTLHSDESNLLHWSKMRFKTVIDLKERSLTLARRMWTAYVWYIDCDVFFTNPQTLNVLIAQQKTIVAPMLDSLGAYSNYWCGINDDFYYKRTDDYMPILERKKSGCFKVPMVHSCLLVDLRMEESQSLSFDPQKQPSYTGPIDDIICFAMSAKAAGVAMHIVNSVTFGFIMCPLEEDKTLQDDYEQLTSIKVEVIVENNPLHVSNPLQKFVKKETMDKLGFDEAYLINLNRRPERRVKMLSTLKEIGVNLTILTAVDGRQLNHSYLEQLGVRMLPEYTDPYHKRPLTMGEIGCFLSHYNIWKQVVDNNYQKVIVFEDDIRFEPYFRKKLKLLMQEAEHLQIEWDLIYLGRKRLMEKEEPYVNGASSIVWAGYSYWTLCYTISLNGAKKLLNADPLSKLVPVDEFLPIMFDKHPEVSWKGYYQQRNLKAYSAAPLLVYPSHYTGEKDYVSDTEDSSVLNLKIHEEF